MPKLSVIVPVYNTEKYLRECIDSILAQTFTDFELILVDDGSTDNSGTICDEYAEKDPRIQVIHQQNGGATAARRSGVRCACGEYITFVDSDDWISEDMYRIMVEHTSADIVICKLMRATSMGMAEMCSSLNPGVYDKRMLNESFYTTMLFDYNECRPAVHPSLCNKMIRSEIIRDVINTVDDSITYGEDALCSYICMLHADCIHVIDQGLYFYRENFESVSNVYNKRMFSALISLGMELKRQFSEFGCDLQSQVCGYLSRHALECIRNELLYNSNASYKEKQKRIKKFINSPLLAESLHYAIPRIKDRKTKFKLTLMKYRMIGLLYFLYMGRNMMPKRIMYEN